MNYGLLAAEPVRWLLSQELDVKRAVEAWLENRGDDYADVVGPPSMTSLLLFRANPKNKLGLPTVRLRFKKIDHPIHGQGVAVECTPEELEMIDSWRRQASARKALNLCGND